MPGGFSRTGGFERAELDPLAALRLPKEEKQQHHPQVGLAPPVSPEAPFPPLKPPISPANVPPEQEVRLG